jgi:hypothetical protein
LQLSIYGWKLKRAQSVAAPAAHYGSAIRDERGAPLSTSSYAGLTRVSIPLHKIAFPKWMDCRVKPGNDESEDYGIS